MEVDLTAITAEEEAAESKRREEEEAKALQMLLASTSVSATEAVAETDDECVPSTPACPPHLWESASPRLALRLQNAVQHRRPRAQWRGQHAVQRLASTGCHLIWHQLRARAWAAQPRALSTHAPHTHRHGGWDRSIRPGASLSLRWLRLTPLLPPPRSGTWTRSPPRPSCRSSWDTRSR